MHKYVYCDGCDWRGTDGDIGDSGNCPECGVTCRIDEALEGDIDDLMFRMAGE